MLSQLSRYISIGAEPSHMKAGVGASTPGMASQAKYQG